MTEDQLKDIRQLILKLENEATSLRKLLIKARTKDLGSAYNAQMEHLTWESERWPAWRKKLFT